MASPDFLILQSAALPYRIEGKRIEVLLITNSQGDWITPKGHREPYETPQEAAATEAWEEAGAVGEVLAHPIGCWTYEKRGGRYRVEIFPLLVTQLADSWPERAERRRRWCTVEKAAELIGNTELSKLVLALPEFLICHQVGIPGQLRTTA